MGELTGLGRMLIGAGVVLAAIGLVLVLAPHVPGLQRLGRLPGDLVFERGPVTVFIPIVSSIVISFLLTLILNLFVRH